MSRDRQTNEKSTNWIYTESDNGHIAIMEQLVPYRIAER